MTLRAVIKIKWTGEGVAEDLFNQGVLSDAHSVYARSQDVKM